MASSPIDGLYWDSHWPLALKNLVDDVRSSVTNGVPSPNSSDDSTHVMREWFSQPRASNDPTIEVITVNFRLPLSLGEISFEAQRVPVRIEMWYQDRLNNWRQVFDRQRIPVSVTLSASSQVSWYKHHAQVYPVVAKAVQLRCVRLSDPLVGATPYTIGIRNTLLRRNVYDRTDGQQAFEDELDPIGNVVSKYIKDWDAPRAIDDQPLTFWRSAPQPDHQAVVSLYLNTCNADGSPQLVDGIFIDPVYTGQNLNIYYSNDQTVGTRKMSVITLPPSTDANTEWRVNRGRWDTSSAPSGTCSYVFPIAVGPLVRQDVWVGLEWTPDFDPVSGPAQNPVLLSVTPVDPDPNQYWPKISYDVGAGEIQLELTNGTTTKIYQVALSPVLIPGEPLRIVVGWRYDPATVLISVRTRSGAEIARLEDTDPELPDLVTLDGQMGFSNFRGLFTSHIVKLEDFEGKDEDYQANPSVYVSPDPVIPDANGTIPTTTLDNAIYAVDWTLQTHGSGGSHDSFYENKTWTPIWRDYTTTRGKLFLPQSISMRYLKLEFTNLTEEPYPVYDAGIQTTYKVYPMQVQWFVSVGEGTSKTRRTSLQMGSNVNLGRLQIPSVNWLNPTSVAQAVDAIFGSTVTPVAVNAGNALTFSTTQPATPSTSDTDTGRNEAASPYVYRRDPIDPQVLAAQVIAGLGNEDIQNLTYNGYVWNTMNKGFGPPNPPVANPGALPVQGQDWWLFPGGTLAMPAVVMNGLTQTNSGRKPDTTTRLRFAITSIHRYDTKTLTRDNALAYFAGVREVRALTKSYIDEQDPEAFEFSVYDPNRWVFSNTRQLDSGPVTTAGKVYQIENPGFDLSTAFWDFSPAEDWSRDVTKGRWHWGSASVTADGEEKYGHSSFVNVVPGDNIKFSCWVMWEDLVATDGEPAIALGGTTYLADEPVEDVVFGTVEYADWSEHPNSVQNAIWSLAVLGDPDGGTFNVEVEGDDADIDFDADETEIQTALEGLSSVGAGNVRVTLVSDQFEVEFINDLGSTLVDTFVVDGTLLTGGTDPDAEGTLIQQASPDVPTWVRVEGTWEVPAGVDQVRIRPSVTEDATAGQVWFDGFVALSDDEVLATLYKEFITTSTFAKVRCDFRDSGLVRSDSMWARADPLATNIDNLKLAYYVETIPDNSSSGMWGDSFGTWADDTIQWGAPNALVAISVDPNRIFDGRRVLKFARAAGAGEAGIKILQTTNFVADGLVRLCATFLKPLTNDNTVTLRLRRLSDGVYIHEEVINKPPVGYWYTYQGQFIEIPDGADQAYEIELVTEGDSEDELLVNDCFCEIALIRYFIQLGGSGGFMHDVTSLRYADNSAQVVTTTPTNECSVQVAVLSPKSFAYGAIVSPMYLR